jgi:hypothetical protein
MYCFRVFRVFHYFIDRRRKDDYPRRQVQRRRRGIHPRALWKQDRAHQPVDGGTHRLLRHSVGGREARGICVLAQVRDCRPPRLRIHARAAAQKKTRNETPRGVGQRRPIPPTARHDRGGSSWSTEKRISAPRRRRAEAPRQSGAREISVRQHVSRGTGYDGLFWRSARLHDAGVPQRPESRSRGADVRRQVRVARVQCRHRRRYPDGTLPRGDDGHLTYLILSFLFFSCLCSALLCSALQ